MRVMNTEHKVAEGEFAALPNGERVFVEGLGVQEGNIPARAVVRRVDGDQAGTRRGCWVSSLKPLGPQIPINAAGSESNHRVRAAFDVNTVNEANVF